MRAQVVVPVGMGTCAGIGGHDDDAVAIHTVTHPCPAREPTPCSDGCEQQKPAVGQSPTELAACGPILLDQRAVEFAHICDVVHACAPMKLTAVCVDRGYRKEPAGASGSLPSSRLRAPGFSQGGESRAVRGRRMAYA